MFDRIAGVYDVMNSVMTAGLHHQWRRRAVDLAAVGPGTRALDVATGTGDLAIELASRGGARSSAATSPRGCSSGRAPKAPAHHLGAGRRAWRCPYADDAFDAATVGFGARNFGDLRAACRDGARRPAGRAGRDPRDHDPAKPPLSTFFSLWFDRVVPLLGRLPATDAYTYLPSSVKRFPGPGGARRRAGSARAARHPLDPHGGRHHRIHVGTEA